jgi:hypothetical protein
VFGFTVRFAGPHLTANAVMPALPERAYAQYQ